MYILLLFLLALNSNAQEDDYFEELNPSKFKIFGPFRDPPIQLARTTTEVPSIENETSTSESKHRDEFVIGEGTSNDNYPTPLAVPNNCQYACQPVQPCMTCTCAAPKPVCIPRPVPICPPPPPPLICPPPQCPKPAACPPCLQIPSIPTPCVCPAPPRDCCCIRPCRRAKFAMRGVRLYEADQTDVRCNSEEIHRIIVENISNDLERSKERIQLQAQKLMQKTLNVICGHGDFSYIVQTNLYCQHSIGSTTCYVFESI